MKTEEDPGGTLGNRLREIADLALRRAIDKAPDPNQQPTRGEYLAYLREVWVDWKLAQSEIVKDLLNIHVQRTALQEMGREARDSHNKGLTRRLRTVRENLHHTETILRSIANSMVWLMFYNRRWIVRRLWVRGSPPVPINSINRETSVFVYAVNRNPNAVALLADITSLVGVGDVIVTDLRFSHEPQVIELKGGATNERVISLVEEYGTDLQGMPPQVLESIADEMGPRGLKHFGRVARQKVRAQNFESFANDDVGADPETGVYARNLGPERGVDTYDAALQVMILEAARKGSVVECVEDCLWVGVYRREAVSPGLRESFVQEVSDRGGTLLCTVWNLQSVCFDPRLQPLFLRDLELESILDIALGNVVVLIYIDWDAFLEQVRDAGINARWTTSAERKDIIAEFYHERAFRNDGHLPIMEQDGRSFTSMGGHVGRIVNEGLSPRCLLEMIQSSFGPQDEATEKTDARQQSRVLWVNSREMQSEKDHQ